VDPCSPPVLWSSIGAADTDATLAGVLAGLLIAAAAALIVQWYQGSDAHTIALFGSGVPVLALSTFLFTIIAGMDLSDISPNDVPVVCPQLWSQWLLAINVLFVGSAILVCGLGWALVSYGDTLAVRFCERNFPIETVEDRRRFFILLNSWLTATMITASIAILVVTNILYLKAIGYPYVATKSQDRWHYSDQINVQPYKENLHNERYLIFFVYLFGVYLIGRASYVVFVRTRSARRANEKSCAAYAAGGPSVAADKEGMKSLFTSGGPAGKDPRLARRKKLPMRAAQKFVVVVWVALSALLAVYPTSKILVGRYSGGFSANIVIWVVVVYVLIAGIVELIPAKKYDTPAAPLANAESVERIRIQYNFGMLSITTYGVVLFVVLGTFLVAALTQGSLWKHGPPWTNPQIIISLFLGGLYPALVLTGLSSSVPAADDVESPKWEIVGRRIYRVSRRIYRDALSSRGLN
jgi:hypothetical protein